MVCVCCRVRERGRRVKAGGGGLVAGTGWGGAPNSVEVQRMTLGGGFGGSEGLT